jgi:two-component system CheB/CheR fusion protein
VLRAAQETRFDLLISDIRLPDGTGTHLLRTLLGTTHPHIKAIAVSGLSMEVDVDASARAGFDHHIAKPISFPGLGDLIPKMLG